MIDRKAREIALQVGNYNTVPYRFHEVMEAARLGIIEGLEMAIKALQDDAKMCDCSAWEEGECACGAWCEWKTIPSHRAVEIVRALIEEQKV